MYSRSFSSADRKKDSGIPIEYFSDSFSADAFKKTHSVNSMQNYDKNSARSQDIANQPPDNADKKEIAPTKSVRNYNFEDLILLGLLLLFMNDVHSKEDLLIPVILGTILLS